MEGAQTFPDSLILPAEAQRYNVKELLCNYVRLMFERFSICYCQDQS
jgi:hypothetical protein